MPTPVVNGTPNEVRKADRIRFDPTRGLIRELVWEAARPEILVARADLLLAGRVSYEFDQGVPARIVASASGADIGQPEVTTDDWQVIPNELQIHIFEDWVARGLEAAVPGALAQVTRNLNRMQSETITLDDLSWKSPVVASTDLDASKLLLDRLLRNETHKGISQYVLYHTTSVPQNYTTNIADDHIDQIYTTVQLLAEVTDGSLWTYPLPARLITKINNIVTPTARDGWTIGWRKLASKENTAADNRVHISTEYWYGQWDTLLKYFVWA